MAGSIRRQQVPSASSERAQRGQETPAAARSDGRRGIPNAISASAFEPNASPSASRPGRPALAGDQDRVEREVLGRREYPWA
jgi:hypothetical protein